MTIAQDVVVTLVAAGALGIVARRVLGFARTSAGAAPKCAGCESSACAPAPASTASDAGRPATHPLVFVRAKQ